MGMTIPKPIKSISTVKKMTATRERPAGISARIYTAPPSEERGMTTWHRLGTKSELLERVPFSVKVDRHAVAVFFYDGQFRAIGNTCNHKGGPLCDGRLRGEFVMCPWHAWEYSVITGRGPEGYDEEQVPGFALDAAKRRGADTQYIKLRDLKFRHCEGNYSKASHACTWPCAITERDPEDQLTAVYEGLVHWADVVVLSTPIRWGNASSLYYKMIERLNCVQNQITIHNRVLIRNKVAAFIITGGQDNIQAVAGGMFTFWSELGFVFPPFPFIAHSRGWDAEDMQNNVRQVKASDQLREASYELVDRSLDFWTILDRHKAEMDKPMERAGRKANTLPEPEEVAEITV